MERSLSSWYSPHLHKEMPIAVYGHYGFALLMVPTAAADYLEYERFELINSLSPLINAGKLKIFSINSINTESWMNDQMNPRDKSIRHQQFNNYIFEEVLPFIKTHTDPRTPIVTCGASFGALHSMNLFLKRPDLINGVIGLSGVYDLPNIQKVILTTMFILTARSITYLTSPTMQFWNRYENLILFIFSAEAAPMKIQMQAEVLPQFYITKASLTNWIFGEASGRTIGKPGEPHCLIVLEINFRRNSFNSGANTSFCNSIAHGF